MGQDKLTVLCWKWNNGPHPKKGFIFGAYHVNVLYAMIKRNLHISFEMACITDNAKGINPEIRIIPLWNDLKRKGGCFIRLKAFAADAEKFLGTKKFVSIDLDAVIIDDITSLFVLDEAFIIWGEDWRKLPYCGALWMLKCGTRPHVWDRFNPDDYQPNVRGNYSKGSDQQHINKILYPGEVTWTTKDGIYNFATDIKDYGKNTKIERDHFMRVHCRPGFKKIKGSDGTLPKNAKIIFFNGRHDPSDPKLQEKYIWITDYWHL